jgi:hypothetical protein
MQGLTVSQAQGVKEVTTWVQLVQALASRAAVHTVALNHTHQDHLRSA